MIIPLCAVLTLLAVPTLGQDSGSVPISPCPSVFMYDLSESVPGQWSGVVNLTTDTNLHSLWLNIVLDNKADILGNSVGEVSTADNKNYKIENINMEISPGSAVPVNFFVKYNPLNKTPRLQTIRSNGREICNVNTLQFVNRPDIEETGKQSIPGPGIQVPYVMFDQSTKPVREPPEESPRPVFQRPRNNNEQSLNIEPDDYQIPEQDTPNSNRPGRESQCGKVILNAVPLVVNGTPTLEGQWPWQIALYQSLHETVDVLSTYMCGGTLVTHKHVITAAHCVTLKQPQRLVDHNTLTVYLGKHNLRTSDDKMQIRLVEKITVHPDYSSSPHRRDVAILELREPVTYSDWVRPACLWPDNEVDLKNVIGKTGSVVGWGSDDIVAATEELKLVEMPVVSQETCINSYREFFQRFSSDYTYCAGYRDGTSPCNGDSGGGMVFKMNGIWYLRGLVSLSALSADGYSCDPSHYIIFTDLAKYLPWIYDNVSNF